MKSVFCLAVVALLTYYEANASLASKIGSIFQNMDFNKDFFIVRDEIGIYFASYDQQAGIPGYNVSVDRAEFDAGWSKYNDGPLQVEHNFNVFDSDRSGTLNLQDVAKIMNDADTDKSNNISFGEFDAYAYKFLYISV